MTELPVYVQLPSDASNTGKKISNRQTTDANSNIVFRQVINIGDSQVDAQIANVTPAGGLQVDGSAVTQPVSVASLPLPSGGSTAALQTSGNASLATLATNLPVQGQALAAASMPVVLTAAQITTLTPPTTVAISNFPSTQPVSGTVTANAGTNLNTSLLALESGGNLAAIVTKLNASIVVTGAFFQATQPISAVSLPLPTGAATSANQTSAQTSLTTIATNTTNAGTPTVIQGVGGLSAWLTNLSQISGSALTLGQKTAASSIPVTLASDNGISQAAVSPATTSAPSAIIVMAGKSNDGTPKYNSLSMGANNRSVIIEPYYGAPSSDIQAAMITHTSKGSAGNVISAFVQNTSGTTCYFQIWDNATAGSGTLKECIQVAAGAAGSPSFQGLNLNDWTQNGLACATGITWGFSSTAATYTAIISATGFLVSLKYQ